MNEYTPTTEEVRNCYAANPPAEHWHPSRHVHRVAFDRWLDSIERAASEAALMNALGAIGDPMFKVTDDYKVSLPEVKAWLLECAKAYREVAK